MKNCKLIVTDLDGTLLRNDKTVSDFTIKTLQACRDRGILIAFATARSGRGVVAELREMVKPDIMINQNGAFFEHQGNQAMLEIARETLAKILTKIFAIKSNAEVGISTYEAFYANYNTRKYWQQYERHDFNEINFSGTTKIMISLEEISLEELQTCLPDDLYIEIADGYMAMIMNKNATKFNAISTICNELKIDLAEVVSFGDDDNDVLMIQGCGVGVAMANANPRVKAVANTECLSNKEDGVARWLQEFVLV